MKKMTKKKLDNLMNEYDWVKNDVATTIYYLDYMHGLYTELYYQENEKYIKKLAKDISKEV